MKNISHGNGILEVSLNHPERLNALSLALLSELSQTLRDIKHDRSIKAILLTGEGKAFCAGADINELEPLDQTSGIAFAKAGQAVFDALEQLGKPSVAAIQGFALGGGCELAMAATIRIAADNAVFGQPEVKLGVIPGFGGTQRLSRLVGKGRALELCLTGRRFSAIEACEWGLVSEVVIPSNLMSRCLAILNELANMSPVAMHHIMSAINDGYNLPFDKALDLEAMHFGACCHSADKNEGVRAFIEKRAAIFTGK